MISDYRPAATPEAGEGVRPRSAARAARLEAGLMLLVLGAAAFYRFWRLGSIPPGMDFDEAFESLEAHRLLTQPGYHPIFFPGNNGVPPVKIYLTALAFLVGGEHTQSIRYVSAVVGTLTVLALYVLARRMMAAEGKSGANGGAYRFLPFVAAMLLAVLPWHVTFSRHGIEVILLPLWATLAVLFLWYALESRRGWQYAVSGVFWGSTFYTYQAGWLLPGLLVLFILYKVWQDRGFLRRHAVGLLLLVAVAGVVAAPLAVYAVQHRATFIHRTSQVGVFALGQGSEKPLLSLAVNTWKVAKLFFVGGDIAITDNIAMRPPLPMALAILLVVGSGVAIRRFKRPAYALLVIWFGWLLVPSILTENAPSIRRAAGVVPAMAALIALGATWLVQTAGNWAPVRKIGRARPALAGAALGLLLVGTAGWGYRYYFSEWSQGKDLFHFFDVGLMETGQYAASQPATTHLYYSRVPAGDAVHLPLTWQVRDRDLRTYDGEYGLVLAPPDGRPTLYLVTVFQGDRWSLPALQQIYPAGRVAFEARNDYNILHSLAFQVAPETRPVLKPQNAIGANFANEAELVGADLSGARIQPGATLTVTLYWRSLAGPTSESRTVFTHLLGGTNPATGNPVWAGQDAPPVNDSYPTTRWAKGEIIVDRHAFVIPKSAPPGAYQVEAGLYAPNGGSRLSVLDLGGSAREDSVIVAVLGVQP